MTDGNPMSSSRPPRVELLSSARVEQVVGEAIAVLSRVGVVVENAEAVERLTSSGATLTDDRTRVLIPENLVDQCLRTAPDHFTLYDRDGEAVGFVGRGKERHVDFPFGVRPSFCKMCLSCVDLCPMTITPCDGPMKPGEEYLCAKCRSQLTMNEESPATCAQCDLGKGFGCSRAAVV